MSEGTVTPQSITAQTPLTPEVIREWIRPIEDPDIGVSLVDLGLIYDCSFDPAAQKATVVMTLTSPACPAAQYLMDQMKLRLMEHGDVKDAHVELVFEPKWDPKTMASDEVKERLGIW